MNEAVSQGNEKHCSALTAGVDEVGRGALAGDVFAAAVILDKKKSIDGLKDSKQLSEKKKIPSQIKNYYVKVGTFSIRNKAQNIEKKIEKREFEAEN